MIKIINGNFERIFILLFSILPIIDSINGILVQNNFISFGMIYKGLVIGFLIIYLVYSKKINKKTFQIVAMVLGYIGIVMAVNVLLLSGTFISLSFPIKLLINFLLFITFLVLTRHKIINGNTFYRILNNSTNLILICFLLPYIFGLGNSIYSGNLGYKGFFFSQNELNAILIILFYFCLYKVTKTLEWKSIGQLLAMTVSILLMSTKSSLIAVAVGYIFFLIEFYKKKDIKTKRRMLILLTIILIGSSGFIKKVTQALFARQSSLFSMYDNSLLDTLLSGRTFNLVNAWEVLTESPYRIVHFFIGNGFISDYLIEMDFLDVFFYLGIVGLIAVIIFLGYVFFNSVENFKQDNSVIRAVCFIMMIAFMNLTGHILLVSTSGWYFIILCSFNMTYNIQKNGGNYETNS